MLFKQNDTISHSEITGASDKLSGQPPSPILSECDAIGKLDKDTMHFPFFN